jgi:hypothetical protein
MIQKYGSLWATVFEKAFNILIKIKSILYLSRIPPKVLPKSSGKVKSNQNHQKVILIC